MYDNDVPRDRYFDVCLINKSCSLFVSFRVRVRVRVRVLYQEFADAEVTRVTQFDVGPT